MHMPLECQWFMIRAGLCGDAVREHTRTGGRAQLGARAKSWSAREPRRQPRGGACGELGCTLQLSKSPLTKTIIIRSE